MNSIAKRINKILAKWDPLNVGEDISIDEYQGYVSKILNHIESKEALTNCLESILINDLVTGYNKEDEMHKKMVDNIVEKILNLK